MSPPPSRRRFLQVAATAGAALGLGEWAALLPLSPASADEARVTVYRSDDQGASWIRAGEGLPAAGRVHSLAVEGATAYARADDGLFASADGGRTWASRRMAPASPVQCFTVVGRRVYAGTRNAGVFVTEDRGRSWRQVADGLPDRNVRSLESRGPLVYAGTDSHGVFVLAESAERWVAFGSGLPERPQVFGLAVKGRHLYAALYSKGLYRLDAAGGRWQRVGRVTPLEFLVRGDALIAGHNPGGIYHSTNGGTTWKLARGLPGDPPIWVLGSAGPNLLAGTSPGAIAISDDLGASWRPGAAGLPPGSAVVAIGASTSYVLAAVLLQGDKQPGRSLRTPAPRRASAPDPSLERSFSPSRESVCKSILARSPKGVVR